MDNEIYWSGQIWMRNLGWGNAHPDLPYMWYDPFAIEKENSKLILRTQKSIRPGETKQRIGIGLVASVNGFGYGSYEILAKLPKGKHLWPAFWLIHMEKYPPEIDVFEAYSNEKASYCNKWWRFFNPWKIESNFHVRINESKVNVGAKRHRPTFRRLENHFVSYKVIRLPYSVKILYNNRVVRSITNPKMLNYINQGDMRVIINNGVRPEATDDYYEESPFEIKYFNFIPLT